MFLDADDLLQGDALQLLFEQLKKGFDCVIYNLAFFQDERDSGIKRFQFAFPNMTEFCEADKDRLLELHYTTGAINSIVCKVFRRGMIHADEMNRLPRIAIGEDGLYTANLLEHANTFLFFDHEQKFWQVFRFYEA